MKHMNNRTIFKKLKTDSRLPLMLMAAPALMLFLIFNYLPLSGIVIAFKNFRVVDGIWGSPWAGFSNFKFFFGSQDAWRITKNTLMMNSLFISIGLIVSVTFAIMLSELKSRWLVKTYQTVFFFPYFVSWVVAGYMLYAFLNIDLGILNSWLGKIGIEPVRWYLEPGYWKGILILSYLWKNVGYFSIIYYAGIMGISRELYEAAAIDGAGKLQQIRFITLPALSSLITAMILLQIGKIFYADFGLFYFLPRDIGILYPATDVIDTYVYRSLRVTGNIGMSAAVGLYQSVVGFLLVLSANGIVRKINSDQALF